MKTILAAPDLLKIEKISFCSDEVRLAVKIRLLMAECPSCGWQSDKAHTDTDDTWPTCLGKALPSN
jgi:hypothetical protein